MYNERRDNVPGKTSTEQFSGNGDGAPPSRQQGASLLIYYRDGVEAAHLAPGQPLVVGRSDPADLHIPDRTLSRKHARFTLLDGRVLVEDLGSRNGTWLASVRVPRAEIEFGGEVMLGKAIAHVLALGMAADPTIESEAAFRRRLNDEVTRAQPFRRSFAVLAVRANDAEAARSPTGVWATQLRAHLRPADRMSLYTPNIALIVLPETDSDKARKVARAVAWGAKDQGARRFVGVALYPETASSPDKLVDLARAAAGRACSKQRVFTASTAPEVEGDVGHDDDTPIIGAAHRRLFDEAKRVASARVPVLLHGETGTGKEVVARWIHDHGSQRDAPFISLNCAAIPATLVESTLFGHEKGSFTGADQQKDGAFAEANKGTLFLDEIGELSAAAQAALLRVLEMRRFSRVGSSHEEEIDVRIIAATHCDLAAMVKEGRFREDLLYRLNTIVLELRPLRERLDELGRLSQRFLKKANKAQGRTVRISEDAMALLREYSWPGNVRELRNVIDRAVLLAQGDLIQPDDMPTCRSVELEVPGSPFKARRQQTEKQWIEAALRKANWNRAKAAKQLGMVLRTLARRIRELDIREP